MLLVSGSSEIMHVLEIEPIFWRGAELLPQFQRSRGGHTLATFNDCGDATVRNFQILPESILADFVIFKRLLERFTGVWVVQWFDGFHGLSGNLRCKRFPGLLAPS